jgi:hypothetical protein
MNARLDDLRVETRTGTSLARKARRCRVGRQREPRTPAGRRVTLTADVFTFSSLLPEVARGRRRPVESGNDEDDQFVLVTEALAHGWMDTC